tara:strand:- start:406 stop:534 length:129 start_codon:yes stop_codon:yes gene_type:complete
MFARFGLHELLQSFHITVIDHEIFVILVIDDKYHRDSCHRSP